MKMILPVLGLLLLAGVASADGIDVNTENGTVVIPDGSTITGTQPITVEGIAFEEIFYSFNGGTGTAESLGPIGAVGTITFTDPVSGLTLGWTGEDFGASDNAGDVVQSSPFSNSPAGSSTLNGSGITSVSWSFATTGPTLGVGSLSYTVDASAMPEPPYMLAIGLLGAALLSFARPLRRS